MSSNYSKNISEQISRLQRKRGLTQEQLASRLGISNQAVSKWENEQSCPEITLLPLLADVFQITMDELFGRKGNTVNLKEGLVAEYLFNGGVKDSSGNELHGQVTGTTLFADRFGQPNRAYYFNGKDNYIVLNPAPPINKEAFTISVWCCYDVNSRQEGWNGAIVSQHGNRKNYAFQLSTSNQHITCHRFLIEQDLSVAAPLQRKFWYKFAVSESLCFKFNVANLCFQNKKSP